MNTTKFNFRNLSLILTILLSFCLLPSCDLFGDEEEDDPAPALTVAFMAGDWLRTGGNNTTNNGMEINVTDDTGTVTDPAGSSLSTGDIKWRNIKVLDESTFEHEELGSDGDYYEATIKVISDDEIEISVAAAGAGNYQVWTRL